jgi:hypothetical protein
MAAVLAGYNPTVASAMPAAARAATQFKNAAWMSPASRHADNVDTTTLLDASKVGGVQIMCPGDRCRVRLESP